MADIDFYTDLRNGFEIGIEDSPLKVSGNRALLNRFEITFLTERKNYLIGVTVTSDDYGGSANQIMNKPQVLSDQQSISTTISMVIKRTVESMKADESADTPKTERIASAEVDSLSIDGDVVTASINVVPVEREDFSVLTFTLPITKVSNV